MTNIFSNIRLYLALLVVATFFVVSVVVPSPTIYENSPTITTNTFIDDDSLLAVNATIVEVLNSHAWERHGTEVNDAFKCLNDKGSTRSFKTFGMKDEDGNPIPTNLWLCQDGDKWYAIITTTLEKVGGNRIGKLVTAYLVDKAKFYDIETFITAIKNQWRAVEINFIVEAGSVLLQPK